MNSNEGIVKKIEQYVLNYIRSQTSPAVRGKIIEAVLKEVNGSTYNTVNSTISSMKKKNFIEQKGDGLWGLPAQDSCAEETEAKAKPQQIEVVAPTGKKVQESVFYQPFADWLVNEVFECTHAVALGKNVLKSKWATPDVIGVFRVHDQGRYKGNQITSFISAEIKLDDSGTAAIEAFGQACAYLEFSHKVYLVLPQTIVEVNKRRIESLAQILGLGLVFFDPTRTENVPFEIRVRPQLREPNPAALNDVLNIEDIFKKLK
jgi:hypothetical protein